MRVLSLFSGIGGIDLGLERTGMKIVGQVENDEFCTKVLSKHWPKVPKWQDIHNVTANDIRRRIKQIDLICGGFPCQDISVAGKGAGIVEGERSGLWREMWRIIRDLRPDWLLIENVPALRTRGADGVLAALEALGYTSWPCVVGAWAVGAPHKRDRIWIVSHSNSDALRKQPRRGCGANRQEEAKLTELGDTTSVNVPRHQPRQSTQPTFAFPAGPGEPQFEWEEPRTIELSLGASVDGISSRLALKAIGNAVVPQIPELFGRWIMEQASSGSKA